VIGKSSSSSARITRASCATRIERKLNKLADVAAPNYATERAGVLCAPGVTVDELVAVVEGAGFTASLHRPGRAARAVVAPSTPSVPSAAGGSVEITLW
jgi:hypothetical protein